MIDTIPRARSTDPQTSADAARSVTSLRPKQYAVLKVLGLCGEMTDERLIACYETFDLPKQSPSGIRTRRHELVAMGLVRDTGERRKMSTGRMAIVWEAV